MPSREEREAQLNAPNLGDYAWPADVGNTLFGSLSRADSITSQAGNPGLLLWVRDEDQADAIYAFKIYSFTLEAYLKQNMRPETIGADGEPIPFTGDYIDVKCTKVKDENNKYPEFRYKFSHREATDPKPTGAMMDSDGIINLDDPDAEKQF